MQMKYSIAAIFDLDGVIANTIDLLYNIYEEISKKMESLSSREEFNYLNGLNIDEISLFLAKKNNLSYKEDDIKNMFIERFQCMYEYAELNPGVVETLSTLNKNNIKIGLASSSKRHHIEILLEKFNIMHYFDFIVSGDDVTHSKPDPEIYTIAKKHSNCDFCFAIEDSTNGLRSAQMAGMIRIYFNPNNDKQEDNNPEYIINTLAEVEDIILKRETILVSLNENIKTIKTIKTIEISESEKKLADKTWDSLTKKNPSLFNDNIAIYISHEIEKDGSLTIVCGELEYKYFLSNMMNKLTTSLTPVGVSGITIDSSEKFLLGKRSNTVSQYAGYYEFVPSGSLAPKYISDKMFLEQIKIELQEETGISQKNINKINEICFIYDKKNDTFDIGIELRLMGSIDITTIKPNEYSSIQLIPSDSLSDVFVLEEVVPTCSDMFYVYLKNDISH